MGSAGLGMKVGGRTGGVMVMSVVVRSYEVSGMGRGDASRREDRWGDGDELSSSGEVDDMGRGKGGQS